MFLVDCIGTYNLSIVTVCEIAEHNGIDVRRYGPHTSIAAGEVADASRMSASKRHVEDIFVDGGVRIGQRNRVPPPGHADRGRVQVTTPPGAVAPKGFSLVFGMYELLAEQQRVGCPVGDVTKGERRFPACVFVSGRIDDPVATR